MEVLKLRVAETFAGDRPVRPVDEWSVPDIERFREELQEKVQGTVSEKWFYTHMKGKDQAKLPRIDTLNLLSRYAGYEDWEDLKAKHPYEERAADKQAKKSQHPVLLSLLILLALGLGAIPFMKNGKETYRICFEDGDTGDPIPCRKLNVELLRKQESPLRIQGDTNGCFKLPRKKGKVRLVVTAPYYRSDTIVRKTDRKLKEERIPLQKDDQALLLHSYSTAEREDLEERRARLDSMIADDARIYQVHGTLKKGIEIYNKEEFIDKLTMPLSSLDRIEVIETHYNASGKIRSIRFQQASESEE